MNNIKLFVHGVPVGHEMYGCDTIGETDYLKQFYDLKLESSFALIIDIVDGISYYTYVRKNNFSNCEGRPNSYFGITISFGSNTCNNVYMLYKILDSIYKQVIVGSGIVNESNTGASFAVRQLEGTTIKNNDIIVLLKNIVKKNIEQHIGESFSPIEKPITTKGKVQFNLEEVDSHAFRESVLSKQVYVSSEFKSSTKALIEMEQKLHSLENDKHRLSGENVSFKDKISQQETEINKLTKEHANAEGKYQDTINDLKSQLETVKAENLNSKRIIDEAQKYIDLIDVPSQKLICLLASRFREESEKGNNKNIKVHQETRSSNKRIPWHQICNTLLLCAILIVSIITLCRFYNVAEINKAAKKPEDNAFVGGTTDVASSDTVVAVQSPTLPPYDKVSECRIDIIGGSDTLKTDVQYKLKLKRKEDDNDANVPEGSWEIAPDSLVDISENSFSIHNNVRSGTNIQITYISSIDQGDKKTRTVKVK